MEMSEQEQERIRRQYTSKVMPCSVGNGVLSGLLTIWLFDGAPLQTQIVASIIIYPLLWMAVGLLSWVYVVSVCRPPLWHQQTLQAMRMAALLGPLAMLATIRIFFLEKKEERD